MPGDKWMVTNDEAFELFARQFEARHRSGAVGRARRTAASLKARGDHPGSSGWADVASRVEELRSLDRVLTRRIAEQP